MVYLYMRGKSLLVFEPSETLVNMFKIYNPRNVKTK